MKKISVILATLISLLFMPQLITADDTTKQKVTKSIKEVIQKSVDQNKTMEIPEQENDDC